MIRVILVIGLGLCGIYVAHNLLQERISEKIDNVMEPNPIVLDPNLCALIYQDMTGSIATNGVEVINASVFTPYFESVNRNIQLGFGIIDEASTETLVTITLTARTFIPPELQDLSKLSITEKRKEKIRFLSAEKKYRTDSTLFYKDRYNRINEFCDSVDTLLSKHRNKLAVQTDLKTCFDVAAKFFNYIPIEQPEKYLLLNSDGRDTYGRRPTRMKDDIQVILINGGSNELTSLDSIITIRLQSPEQAIAYSLNSK